MRGFIVQTDYTAINENTYVQLFGRLEDGKSFATISKIEPYFFIEQKHQKKAHKLLGKFKTEKTELKTFSGNPVIKISNPLQAELNKLSSHLHKLDIPTYESDIKPHNRFLMDHSILGSIEISGESEPSERVDRVYKDPKIKPSDFKPNLKIISLDIESDKDTNKLICIGLYSKGYKQTFMVTNQKLKDTISCKNEAECLSKFRDAIIKQDPDIITGWNVIDFDIKYLQDLFRENKIPFDLGRTNSEVRTRIEDNFFRASSVDMPGRQVLDGLNLLKDPFIKEAPSIKQAKFESYTLEDVSQEILGKGKILKGKMRHDEISQLYKKDQQKLVDYNMTDCQLAYEILEETKMIDLAIERSQLVGLEFDRLTASIAAFDSLYIREARKRGLVSPSTIYGQKEERIKGGYVFSSKPGIYHNVLVLDFKSLYPSILRTYNIDPSSRLDKKEKGAIETPNKIYFKHEDGVLPEIIEKLHHARELAKKEKRELSTYAIKIIMNSFWGVLASPNCRYFNFDMAQAITGFARETIQETAKQIESKGYKVIYSDTDSVFVETGLDKTKAPQLGKEIEHEVNEFYKKKLKDKYNKPSYLELQFEKHFLSLMIPSVRMKAKKGEEDKEQAAAKKRYAGLLLKDGKEELQITGLEAIRGDWTEAAQDFQRALLLKTFHNEPVEKFILQYIKDIRAGKMDKLLVYRKSIRKNLAEYTKTTPPHVKAARLLDSLDSNVIEYYITTNGPEPIQKHKHPLDYDHYIEKQIAPIANQVLSLLGKSFEDLSQPTKQAKLF